ncbi:MAG: Methyl-accepting chemotaxis protein PctC [Syntrophorhabdus sp. PtaU1.Bin058]|nr:MAG: Methyl-accepting chemotaxis protein PctC [Syntrophorhabdus sp. PtaU1.Bin058]
MKNFFMNLKMSKKLLIAPLMVILFFLVFGVVSYLGLADQSKAVGNIYSYFGDYRVIVKMGNDVSDIHANVNKVINIGSIGAGKEEVQDLGKKQLAAIQGYIDLIRKKLKSGGDLVQSEKKLYGELLNIFLEYKKPVEEVLNASPGEVNSATMLMGVAEKYRSFGKTLQELFDVENKLSSERFNNSLTSFRRVIIVFVAVLCIVVIISLVVSIMLTRLTISPVNKLINVIKEIARGDLTKRIEVASRDEIGSMSGHLNAFVEKLHNAIIQVAESSNQVSLSASALDRSAEQMATGVEQAAAQINSVATASEEMSKTSSEITRNCVTAAKSSENANASTVAGESIIRQTILVMNRIDERVKDSARIIRQLGIRSDQIGKVIELINDVADQTNLLALNAAIEAARAGEHGRGFAVVADEVRKLAERTTNATKEIADTIRSMQHETKEAVLSMEEGVKHVEAGAEEATKSGDALKDIIKQINTVTAEVNQIAVASKEQTNTTDEIANNIHQVAEVMQETSKSIAGNASASAQLANLSKDLQKLVGQFRL